MNTSEKLAVRLRVLREVNNYTQEYVANVLEVSPNTYSLLEKGQATLSVDRIEKLAGLYKMSLVELISLADQNYVGTITHSGVFSEVVNVHNTSITEEDRQLYKDTITRLEEQNSRLMALLEKLSGKLG